MARTGRPSTFTPEIGEEICARMVESDFGLEHICDADDMPCARTVWKWLASGDHPEFVQQYARAKERQGHIQAERALKGALEATDASLGRLHWDARRWAASKLAPKAYNTETHKHVGGDETDAPIKQKLTVEFVTALPLLAPSDT